MRFKQLLDKIYVITDGSGKILRLNTGRFAWDTPGRAIGALGSHVTIQSRNYMADKYLEAGYIVLLNQNRTEWGVMLEDELHRFKTKFEARNYLFYVGVYNVKAIDANNI